MSVTQIGSPAPAAELAPASAWATNRLSRDSSVRRLLALSDVLSVALALAFALAISGRGSVLERYGLGLAILPVAVLVFKIYGLYDRDVKRMSHSTVDDVPWLLHAVVAVTLAMWVYARISAVQRFDLTETLLFGLLTMGFCVSGRFVARAGASHWFAPEAAVMVGSSDMAEVLAAKLLAHPEYRARVIGLLANTSVPPVDDRALPTVGSPADLDRVVSAHHVGRVIISPGVLEEGELQELLQRCRELALKVSLLPQLSDLLGPAVEIDDVEGVTVLGVNPPWLPRSSQALKRMLDLASAGTLLILLAPVMAVIAVAIKLDSRGPVFFKQVRVGRRGKRFRVLKFRTMVPDAEARRAELLSQSKDPNWLHLEHDPRITRIGRLLRLSSLDEVPQLWNVVRGEMSMVGPRPLVEAEDCLVQGWARGRLDLTPGITGYWQVLGRTRIPFAEMVKLDYLYVMNWSLWEDIRLMLRTLPVVLRGRGAN